MNSRHDSLLFTGGIVTLETSVLVCVKFQCLANVAVKLRNAYEYKYLFFNIPRLDPVANLWSNAVII